MKKRGRISMAAILRLLQEWGGDPRRPEVACEWDSWGECVVDMDAAMKPPDSPGRVRLERRDHW